MMIIYSIFALKITQHAITNACTVPPLSNSDHDSVLTTTHVLCAASKPILMNNTPNTPKYVYAFARADYDSIAAPLVDTHWETFFTSTITINTAWLKFKNLLHDLIVLYAPCTLITNKMPKNLPV